MTGLKKTILVAGDILALYFSLWLTLLTRYGQGFDTQRWEQHLLPFSFIYFVWLIVFYIAGLYELNLAQNGLELYSTILKSQLINTIIAIAFFYFIPYGITPKTNLFLNLIIFSFILLLWRNSFNRLAKSSAMINNVLFIGRSKETEQIIGFIQTHPQMGYRLAEQIEPEQIKSPNDIITLLLEHKIKTVVTAANPHHDPKLVQALYYALPYRIELIDLVAFYEKILNKVPVSALERVWFLENLNEGRKNFYEAAKRIFDIILSFVFGLISLIFYPLIILVIKIDSRGPAFYTQTRIGQDNKIFRIIKFRSMIQNAEKKGVQWTLENDNRITRIGQLMRKIRMDELPQLLNIFLGQMSFVGPRAERPEFVADLEKEIPYYQIRHMIQPGLTGWAQVNFQYGGASKESALEKLQYELYYIKHRSLSLDLSVILKTVKIVLGGGGR